MLEVWQLLRRTVALVDADLAARLTTDGDEGPPAHEALAVMAAAPHRTVMMRDLARSLGLSTGAVTKVVDRLVDRGLVDRRHSTTDRRVVNATLTPRGAELARRSSRTYVSLLETDFRHVSGEGRVRLAEVCRQVQADLAAPEADGRGNAS